MKNKTQLYEGMYILNATLSEDARSKALDRIKAGITDRGGQVHREHDLGRRKLAYPIQRSREGHYYLLYFTSNSKDVGEIWKEYHLNEDLLRFMTLQTEEIKETLEFKQLPE
ncbi:MAG: 30S ribosomal protein S6 [Chlamydiia bacterium]|nr:30S ribosomal protein S6 [Chlamydiia bacterium]